MIKHSHNAFLLQLTSALFFCVDLCRVCLVILWMAVCCVHYTRLIMTYQCVCAVVLHDCSSLVMLQGNMWWYQWDCYHYLTLLMQLVIDYRSKNVKLTFPCVYMPQLTQPPTDDCRVITGVGPVWRLNRNHLRHYSYNRETVLPLEVVIICILFLPKSYDTYYSVWHYCRDLGMHSLTNLFGSENQN